MISAREQCSSLRETFVHARRAGVKIDTDVLWSMALKLISEASMDSSFHAKAVDKVSGKPISEMINKAWVSRFCSAFDIVQRSQAGKLKCSPQKQEEIDRSIIIHMALLKRGFISGEFREDNISNMDETCLRAMDNKKHWTLKELPM